MTDYLTDVQLLEAELVQVEKGVPRAGPQRRTATQLQPPGGTLRPWILFELAGHVDIAIGVTRMLIASQQDGQMAGTGSAFSSSPLAESPGLLRLRLHHGGGQVAGADGGRAGQHLFARTIAEARVTSRMWLGDSSSMTAMRRSCSWVNSYPAAWSRRSSWPGPHRRAGPGSHRHAEGGHDDRRPFRRTTRPADGAGPPADLAEDLAWVRAASGRAPHSDPRLPPRMNPGTSWPGTQPVSDGRGRSNRSRARGSVATPLPAGSHRSLRGEWMEARKVHRSGAPQRGSRRALGR